MAAARWHSEFTRSELYREAQIQSYVRRDDTSSLEFEVEQPPYKLTLVDTQVGSEQCRADTNKQWQTIITAAAPSPERALFDPTREQLLELKHFDTKKKVILKNESPTRQGGFISVGGGYEEMLNGSEYIKGVGKVPINRFYAEENPSLNHHGNCPLLRAATSTST